MRIKVIREIEKHQLSDGTAGVKKLGRLYTFYRFYRNDEVAPLVETGLTRDQAMERLAGTLRADVLELD